MTQIALEASEKLALEGFACGVLHMHTIKPLDNEALLRLLPLVDGIVTLEEHTRIGGLGSAVLEFCNDYFSGQMPKITRIGIPDKFANQYGTQNSLLQHWGITIDSAINAMRLQLTTK